MLKEVIKSPKISSRDLQQALATVDVKVHDSTIRKRLHKFDFHGRSKVNGSQVTACALTSSVLDRQVQVELMTEEEITNSTCSGYRDQHPHTILYNILSGRQSGYLSSKLHCNTEHNCHCERRRIVCLKDPGATCPVAFSVLVKTICFVRSLPSFSQLPSGDQSSLLRHCWVPLFVLGLAQEKIVFEVTDEPNSSILRQILLGPGLTEKEADRPTLAGVHKLKTCLHQLWDLDLSPKEYAYLKGALLFNPEISLCCLS
ncbi:hypothetical protein L3Q82_002998 [Scortum barcoo]|uniref:Uncharacterized protein n=1 Tax=Scortum barcoo TaxID=214431 RepID=A0ACB8VRC9_9TELE|nr:hypothetical protein L3Q82_002998 [Scortum barcoo]